MTNSKVSAIILAGGQGKRFSPLTTPKQLIKFAGVTMLERAVVSTLRLGISNIVLVYSPAIESNVSLLTRKYPNVIACLQPKSDGMAEAILKAKDIIHTDRVFIKSATGILADDEVFGPIIRNYHPTIMGVKAQLNIPGGEIIFENNRPMRILEKPHYLSTPNPIQITTYHYHTQFKKLCEYIESIKSEVDDKYEQALSKLMSENEYHCFVYDQSRASLKYPWHILSVMKLILKHQLNFNHQSHPKIHPSAIIDSNVYLDDGVEVDAYAIIKGPSYIGRNVYIGNHALIRESNIEADSQVGAYSEVVRSYLGDQVKIHRACIEDSIVESKTNIGAGTVTANLRFDEQNIHIYHQGNKINTYERKLGAVIASNCKVGVNVSIMPGTIIPSNSILPPNQIWPSQKTL